ncbi:N-acetyltransferase family protein [Rapidithrix thailandica]|uniref:N-acetyltransferase family protein n=1 Tax=Rapidithrix thailandica TaxID=413964 RepID=A0AAW9S9P2_9BACT
MSIEVKAAEEKDLPAILEIINYEIRHSTAIYDYEERSPEAQREWLQQKQQEHMPVLVAVLEGQVLGFGTYGTFRPKVGYRFCVEHSVYVSENARGKGAGSVLMEALIQSAKQQGLHSMIAGIDAANQSSYDFHIKFGFEEVGRLKEVGYKFDQWLDLVFMQLLLK